MRDRLVIGSRGSRLALAQTNHIADRLRAEAPGLDVDIQIISTHGDKSIDRPLAEIGGKGLFTAELEEALRDGSIDLAVHSLKDLPTDEPSQLCVAAIPTRVRANDALVAREADALAALPEGATVGTSSLRRKAQLRAVRPDLTVVDIRGNVDTRLAKVFERNEVDAAILACAGLERLGKSDAITEILDRDIMLPAPGQGALGIQARADDGELLQLLSGIEDPAARAETTAERALLAGLGGGCQVPIGALAESSGSMLSLFACVATLDGKRILRAELAGPAADAAALGREAADRLLADGAQTIVADCT